MGKNKVSRTKLVQVLSETLTEYPPTSKQSIIDAFRKVVVDGLLKGQPPYEQWYKIYTPGQSAGQMADQIIQEINARHKLTIPRGVSGKKDDFEDFKLIADFLINRESKFYLSLEDRTLINEKCFLMRKDIDDDYSYLCRIKDIPFERIQTDDGLRDYLFKENQWVERRINLLSYLLNKYMPKLINENKKWVIDYFGESSARSMPPDWQAHPDAYYKAHHKGSFKKGYIQTLEYLKHRNIKRMGYTSKNKHHFRDTHWIRGRIALLGQVQRLLLDPPPTKIREQLHERIREEWRDKIRELFEKGGKSPLYREIIEYLYLDLQEHPWPPIPMKNRTLYPLEFFLEHT